MEVFAVQENTIHRLGFFWSDHSLAPDSLLNYFKSASHESHLYGISARIMHEPCTFPNRNLPYTPGSDSINLPNLFQPFVCIRHFPQFPLGPGMMTLEESEEKYPTAANDCPKLPIRLLPSRRPGSAKTRRSDKCTPQQPAGSTEHGHGSRQFVLTPQRRL